MAITITKPTVGGSNNTWGQQINDALDEIVGGVNGTGSSTTAPNLEEGAFKIGGTVITATGNEVNVLDGDTGVTSTTVEGSDSIVYNDGGVMKQVSLSDIATYMQSNGHADTSSQSSVNNSGSTYIQDITLDDQGHVTAITSTDAASSITSVTPTSVENVSSSGFFKSTTRNATAGTYYIAMGGHSGQITSVGVGTPNSSVTITSNSSNSETHRAIFYKFT